MAFDPFLAPLRLGHNSGDGSAMARDEDGLTALYVIEYLEKMGLCLRGLDFAHGTLNRLVDPTGLRGIINEIALPRSRQ